METKKLSGIKACVFDAYGTLFDFNSAVNRCKADIGDRADDLSRVWRERQLQYTWLRSLMGIHEDFRRVTEDALRYAMNSLTMHDDSLRERLMELYETLDAFPDVTVTLEKLRSAGVKRAILSNGSPEMLAAAVESSGIARLLDHVLSVEDVGIYKPHPSVYKLAADAFDLKQGQICFVSSNAWDAYGASAFGLRVIWCNRYGQKEEILPGKPDAEVASLAEIPGLLEGV